MWGLNWTVEEIKKAWNNFAVFIVLDFFFEFLFIFLLLLPNDTKLVLHLLQHWSISRFITKRNVAQTINSARYCTWYIIHTINEVGSDDFHLFSHVSFYPIFLLETHFTTTISMEQKWWTESHVNTLKTGKLLQGKREKKTTTNSHREKESYSYPAMTYEKHTIIFVSWQTLLKCQ